jgi:hypothetical protein
MSEEPTRKGVGRRDMLLSGSAFAAAGGGRRGANADGAGADQRSGSPEWAAT